MSAEKRPKTEQHTEEDFDEGDTSNSNSNGSLQSQHKGKGERQHAAQYMQPYPTSQYSRPSTHDQTSGLHSIHKPNTQNSFVPFENRHPDYTMHNEHRNTTNSSASRPFPSQQPQQSQQPNRQTNQKGKGKSKGYTIPHNGELQDLVEFTRRSCIRTMEQQRQTQREQNFVMEIPTDNHEIRDNMLSLIDNYKNERPATGPHPLGNLHDIFLVLHIRKMDPMFGIN
jgi:hypothetical protein